MELNAKKIAQTKGISIEAIAAVWGVHRNSAAHKLNGITPVTVTEAFKLRDALFPEYNLDFLFSPVDAHSITQTRKRKGA